MEILDATVATIVTVICGNSKQVYIDKHSFRPVYLFPFLIV
jgi:hypothetical protein